MVCLSGEEHERILEKICKLNRSLETLTKDSLALELGRSGRRRGREPFRRVRDCARILHNGLQLSWSSNCASTHSADLRLEIRDCNATPSFRLLLPHANSPSPTQSDLLLWLETVIRPIDHEKHHIRKQHEEIIRDETATQLPPLTMGSSKSHIALISSSFQLSAIGSPFTDHKSVPLLQTRQPKKKQKKKVTWAQATTHDLEVKEQCRPVAGTSSDMELISNTEAKDIENSELSKITDLCHTLKTMGNKLQENRCLGCLVDQQVDEHSLLGIYVTGQRTAFSLPQDNTMTLKDLLSSNFGTISGNTALVFPPETTRGVPRLDKKNRLRLAITLASTALQLNNTPWLHDQWGNEDILFHDGSVEHLYISKSFETNPDEPQQTRDSPWTPVRNESIFNLGVLLIELSYGRSLDSFQTPGDHAEFTKYAIATRLVNSLAGEETEGYVSATRTCIFCDFGAKIKSLSLDNPSFRQVVYDDVFVPLEEDWKHWNRLSA